MMIIVMVDGDRAQNVRDMMLSIVTFTTITSNYLNQTRMSMWHDFFFFSNKFFVDV